MAPKYTIHSPAKKYTGSTAIGPTILDFSEGVATTDVELNEGTLAYLKASGYEVKEAEDEEPEQDDDSEQASDGPFDPADHKVEDVIKYLEEADEDEQNRVLDLEEEGKGRKTILDWEPEAS